MGRKRIPAALALLHELKTRVTAHKYEELQRILRQNPNNDMSGLLRDILNKQPVKVFTQDQTFNNLMEELSKLRSEIRAIGVTINQITRFFNTYPDQGLFDNWKAGVQRITANLALHFGLEVSNLSRVFQEILSRKNGRTVLLNRMINSTEQRMDRENM